jgi:hypothetical protein
MNTDEEIDECESAAARLDNLQRATGVSPVQGALEVSSGDVGEI